MGRPKKEKRIANSRRINLRPSLPELEALEANAAKANLPVTTYTLQAALKGTVETRQSEDMDKKKMEILSGIGNNLNQLAKRANQEKSITPVLQEVYLLVQQLKKRLRGENAESELESANNLNN